MQLNLITLLVAVLVVEAQVAVNRVLVQQLMVVLTMAEMELQTLVAVVVVLSLVLTMGAAVAQVELLLNH
jgi:hypothetical protein